MNSLAEDYKIVIADLRRERSRIDAEIRRLKELEIQDALNARAKQIGLIRHSGWKISGCQESLPVQCAEDEAV